MEREWSIDLLVASILPNLTNHQYQENAVLVPVSCQCLLWILIGKKASINHVLLKSDTEATKQNNEQIHVKFEDKIIDWTQSEKVNAEPNWKPFIVSVQFLQFQKMKCLLFVITLCIWRRPKRPSKKNSLKKLAESSKTIKLHCLFPPSSLLSSNLKLQRINWIRVCTYPIQPAMLQSSAPGAGRLRSRNPSAIIGCSGSSIPASPSACARS